MCCPTTNAPLVCKSGHILSVATGHRFELVDGCLRELAADIVADNMAAHTAARAHAPEGCWIARAEESAGVVVDLKISGCASMIPCTVMFMVLPLFLRIESSRWAVGSVGDPPL